MLGIKDRHVGKSPMILRTFRRVSRSACADCHVALFEHPSLAILLYARVLVVA